jgi:DDE superfamily endonuclease
MRSQAFKQSKTPLPIFRPAPGKHPNVARDDEYKCNGAASLLAGIDLLTGQVHAMVKDRHRSREFVEFLKLLDAASPAESAIHLIFDNHSAHVSRETKAWLADRSRTAASSSHSRPSTVLGSISWRAFSKLARSALRHIRVASKQELKDRWPLSTSSIAILWFTHGRICLSKLPDTIRNTKSVY